MSKKKSYMDTTNIIQEGAISTFLRALFKGKSRLKRDAYKTKVKLEKNIKDFNATQSRLEKNIEKTWGKKVKLPRAEFEDIVNRAR
jgi:hypothetical protein